MSMEGEDIIEPDPIRRQAYDWVMRFIDGDMSTADIEAMKVWCRESPAHIAAYKDVRRLWRHMGPIARASYREEPFNNSRYKEPVSINVHKPDHIGRRFMFGGAVAATAAYMLVKPPFGLWPSYSEMTADYRTGTGEQKTVSLANAVSLDLNTQTSISVKSQTAAAAEIVLVSGETLISTDTSDVSLTVWSGRSRIRATQSHFDVRHDQFQSCITCLSGSISIERLGSTFVLTTNQQIDFSGAKRASVTATNPAIVTAWQKGILVFNAMSVTRIIEEVNRYRPGRIVLMNEEIGSHLMSAQLRINDLDEIVTQIAHIYGVKVTTLPENVIVLT